MRHRKSGRKFGMDSPARKAMFRNMVTSLMLHGQIKTTEERAKELRGFADRVISIGKRAPNSSSMEGLEGAALQKAKASRVVAIRRARQWVNNDEALERVFGEYADRYRTRPGGYTRVLKVGRRAGDNAAMAIIALVGKFAEDDGQVAAGADDESPEVVEIDAPDVDNGSDSVGDAAEAE